MTSSPNGYDAFRYYKSIKLHYDTDGFDVRKYGYNSKVTGKKFYEKARGAPYHYDKLASKFKTKRGLCHYIGIVMYHNPSIFILDLGDIHRHEMVWAGYKKFMASPEQHVKNDLDCAFGGLQDPKDVLGCPDKHNVPKFVDMISTGGTYAYTAIMLNKVFGWYGKIDNVIGDDHVIWQRMRERLLNLEAFVYFKDPAKYNSVGKKVKDSIAEAKCKIQQYM